MSLKMALSSISDFFFSQDLHVCEGPKKVEDPAIVTHSYSSQSYNPNYHRGPPPFPPQGNCYSSQSYNPNYHRGPPPFSLQGNFSYSSQSYNPNYHRLQLEDVATQTEVFITTFEEVSMMR